MSAQPLYVHATGMACPVGLTAATACAAIRAGIERKHELPYRTDGGHSINGSFLATLGELDIPGRERWAQLLVLALRDIASQRAIQPSAVRPLVLALPAEASRMRGWLVDRLSRELSLAIEPAAVHVVCEGSSGGHRALAFARTLLTRREAAEVVVGAADSLISARRLLELDRGRRLLTEDNSDGVIPGEAAAVVRIDLQARGAKGMIRGIGFGHEPALLDNDVPLRGQGIVAAARAALEEAGLQIQDMDVRVSDAAGEAYAFREQVLAVSRLLRHNKSSFPLWLGAHSLGDTGTAAGICDLAIVLQAYERRYFPGRRAIAYASSDGHVRSALVVDQVP